MLPGSCQQLLSVGNEGLPAPTAFLIIVVLILLHTAACLTLGDRAGPMKDGKLLNILRQLPSTPHQVGN